MSTVNDSTYESDENCPPMGFAHEQAFHVGSSPSRRSTIWVPPAESPLRQLTQQAVSHVSYPSLARGLVAKRNVKDKGRHKRSLYWQPPGRSRFYQETLQTASLRASKLVAGCILQPAPTSFYEDPLAMCMREGDEIHTQLLRFQSKFN